MTTDKRIAIDILTDCAYAGQNPASIATPDETDLIDAADERFLELVSPAFIAAAERVGVELTLTADAYTVRDIEHEWEDRDALRATWQAVHDAVDVDIPGLARQALNDVVDFDPEVVTRELLADPEAMRQLAEAEADVAAGRVIDADELRRRFQ